MNQNNTTTHAVFSGTFDPPTRGHLDIIKRAANMFGKLTVVIAHNPAKKHMFTAEERRHFINNMIKDLPNVDVIVCEGLLVDACHDLGASVIVRGIRSANDVNYEIQMAQVNRELAPDVETVFLMASESNSFLSSSVVKEIASFGKNIDRYVTKEIAEAIYKKL